MLLRVGLYASSPTLLQAKLPRTPYPDGRATVGGRKESMNIIASASKVVAVSVKGVQKNLNLVNTSSLVGSIIRSAKDGWAEGVAQVNSTQPRVKTPKTESRQLGRRRQGPCCQGCPGRQQGLGGRSEQVAHTVLNIKATLQAGISIGGVFFYVRPAWALSVRCRR